MRWKPRGKPAVESMLDIKLKNGVTIGIFHIDPSKFVPFFSGYTDVTKGATKYVVINIYLSTTIFIYLVYTNYYIIGNTLLLLDNKKR